MPRSTFRPSNNRPSGMKAPAKKSERITSTRTSEIKALMETNEDIIRKNQKIYAGLFNLIISYRVLMFELKDEKEFDRLSKKFFGLLPRKIEALTSHLKFNSTKTEEINSIIRKIFLKFTSDVRANDDWLVALFIHNLRYSGGFEDLRYKLPLNDMFQISASLINEYDKPNPSKAKEIGIQLNNRFRDTQDRVLPSDYRKNYRGNAISKYMLAFCFSFFVLHCGIRGLNNEASQNDIAISFMIAVVMMFGLKYLESLFAKSRYDFNNLPTIYKNDLLENLNHFLNPPLVEKTAPSKDSKSEDKSNVDKSTPPKENKGEEKGNTATSTSTNTPYVVVTNQNNAIVELKSRDSSSAHIPRDKKEPCVPKGQQKKPRLQICRSVMPPEVVTFNLNNYLEEKALVTLVAGGLPHEDVFPLWSKPGANDVWSRSYVFFPTNKLKEAKAVPDEVIDEMRDIARKGHIVPKEGKEGIVQITNQHSEDFDSMSDQEGNLRQPALKLKTKTKEFATWRGPLYFWMKATGDQNTEFVFYRAGLPTTKTKLNNKQ